MCINILLSGRLVHRARAQRRNEQSADKAQLEEAVRKEFDEQCHEPRAGNLAACHGARV